MELASVCAGSPRRSGLGRAHRREARGRRGRVAISTARLGGRRRGEIARQRRLHAGGRDEPDDVGRALDAARERLGGINVLVN